jgi:hypothetical protein
MGSKGFLLVMAILVLAGCAGMGAGETGRNDTISRAALCAMCGASVSGDYFLNTTDKSIGPGQGW